MIRRRGFSHWVNNTNTTPRQSSSIAQATFNRQAKLLQALYYPRQRHDATWIPWIKNNAKDRRKMP
jgi:hypothetical protein